MKPNLKDILTIKNVTGFNSDIFYI